MNEQPKKWNINLDKVFCPSCGTEQATLRIPKNWEQLMNGGWTCEKCSCKMDKHGNQIPENN